MIPGKNCYDLSIGSLLEIRVEPAYRPRIVPVLQAFDLNGEFLISELNSQPEVNVEKRGPGSTPLDEPT